MQLLFVKKSEIQRTNARKAEPHGHNGIMTKAIPHKDRLTALCDIALMNNVGLGTLLVPT